MAQRRSPSPPRPKRDAEAEDGERRKRPRKEARPYIDIPFAMVASPVPPRALDALTAALAPFRPLRVTQATDFEALAAFPSAEAAYQAQTALQCTPLEGSDLCLYLGADAYEAKDRYNAACLTCVVLPLSSAVTVQELYDLFKPYSGGCHLQVVRRGDIALLSFPDRDRALVAQGVFQGYCLHGKALQITLLEAFDPMAMGPYEGSAYVFPVNDVVSKSDLLDIFDPFLSLEVNVKACVNVNRETSIATVTGFISKVHARLAEKAVNGRHLGGTELMLRHRLSDLSLPKENRVFISNVTDDIVCPDLYQIFKEFKGEFPMQVVIKRSKRYALIGYSAPDAAATAVSTLGNVQVRSSLLYLYLSD